MLTLHDTTSGSGRRAGQRSGTAALFALLAGLALTTGGCSLPGDTGGSGNAAGPAQGGRGSPTGTQPSANQTPGNQTAVGGGYSVEFAKCMRAHGVPNFPDPGGRGPFQSGADPGSSTYQAALNGPCRSLAPRAWVDSGPSIPGGGS
jgi:hypothetical protein